MKYGNDYKKATTVVEAAVKAWHERLCGLSKPCFKSTKCGAFGLALLKQWLLTQLLPLPRYHYRVRSEESF